MVGSYAVGDVRALVPARKAVWSLPGEPKASGKNFLPSIFLYCILTLSLPHLVVLLQFI